MKRASAIVTNRGGRTCHAAIIARELGIPVLATVGVRGDGAQELLAWLDSPAAQSLKAPVVPAEEAVALDASALDAQTKMVLQQDLGRTLLDTGKTALFVTHDLVEAIALSHRVLVMSQRPGRIIREIPVDIARPRALAVRHTPKFTAYREQIWNLLEEQIRASGSWEQTNDQPADAS